MLLSIREEFWRCEGELTGVGGQAEGGTLQVDMDVSSVDNPLLRTGLVAVEAGHTELGGRARMTVLRDWEHDSHLDCRPGSNLAVLDVEALLIVAVGVDLR